MKGTLQFIFVAVMLGILLTACHGHVRQSAGAAPDSGVETSRSHESTDGRNDSFNNSSETQISEQSNSEDVILTITSEEGGEVKRTLSGDEAEFVQSLFRHPVKTTYDSSEPFSDILTGLNLLKFQIGDNYLETNPNDRELTGHIDGSKVLIELTDSEYEKLTGIIKNFI